MRSSDSGESEVNSKPDREESGPTVKGKEMLKTIDPLLNADVLHALRAMRHGHR
jgi:hypothetical protein